MDKFTNLCGLRLHYTDNGDGPRTLLLMHGWGCNLTTVASIERIALEAGWRVVNIDLPGHGQSEEPSEVWGVEDYTHLIELLVETLGIENPAL
ncbi:MAG: alpha/beta hydrolase, partial [Duncaniella sp.]|nr:alpha/beta hydrolase [Duncaniella sp.]